MVASVIEVKRLEYATQLSQKKSSEEIARRAENLQKTPDTVSSDLDKRR